MVKEVCLLSKMHYSGLSSAYRPSSFVGLFCFIFFCAAVIKANVQADGLLLN